MLRKAFLSRVVVAEMGESERSKADMEREFVGIGVLKHRRKARD